jgi:hypothetical protein
MRIGKPLLIGTTVIGVPIGIYEAFALAGRLGFLALGLVGLFGLGILWVIKIARAEARASLKGNDGL